MKEEKKTKVLRVETHRPKAWLFTRRIFPLAFSLLILFYYFSRVNWQGLKESIAYSNLLIFFPSRFFPLVIYLLVDSWLLKRIIDWFHSPISYGDILFPRASLYLLSGVHSQLSNGGMFLYLLQRTKLKARKLIGLVVFRFAWSTWVINFGLSLVLLVIKFSGLDITGPFPYSAIITTLAIIWASFFITISYFEFRKKFAPEKEISPLWEAFAKAKVKHYLEISLLTLVLCINSIISNFLCALSFKISIPPHLLILYLPLADLIISLPIAFAGLGTTTFAWQSLFKQYASAETFLAFTLTLPIITYLSRLFMALLCLPFAWRKFEETIFTKS